MSYDPWMSFSQIDPWWLLLFVFMSTAIVLLGTRRVFWAYLELVAKRTKRQLDRQVLVSLNIPSKIFLVICAGIISLEFTPDLVRSNLIVSYCIKVAVVLLASWASYKVLDVLVKAAMGSLRMTETTRTLVSIVFKVVFFSVTLLMLLHNLGISVTPLLASLGVGSVAGALALQDTLNNVFSGFNILIDKPIRIGDYVKTESGIEGHVAKIGWRATHIRSLTNDVSVIPNSKLASFRVTNYDLGGSESLIPVEMVVGYESDLELVEQVTLELAREVQQSIDGAVPGYEPVIRFHTFGPIGVEFRIMLRISDITLQYPIKSHYMKVIHLRFRKAGIRQPSLSYLLGTLGASDSAVEVESQN